MGNNGIVNARKVHDIDIHVGARVRMRRVLLSMSQEKLAEHLGVTFQQVQKYENGSNRIGASRLHCIAEALLVPVGFFFEGLDGSDRATSNPLSDKTVRIATKIETLSDLNKEAILQMVNVLSKGSGSSGVN